MPSRDRLKVRGGRKIDSTIPHDGMSGSDDDDFPLPSSTKVPRPSEEARARKSRRIARKVGEAGPSGWKHNEEGDERDLVPPSDIEEYEEWKETRDRDRGVREMTASSRTVTPARESSRSHVSGNDCVQDNHL